MGYCHVTAAALIIALAGVTIIDLASGESVVGGTIIVVHGRIARVERGAERPAVTQIVDVAGRCVVPVLIDARPYLELHRGAPGALVRRHDGPQHAGSSAASD